MAVMCVAIVRPVRTTGWLRVSATDGNALVPAAVARPCWLRRAV